MTDDTDDATSSIDRPAQAAIDHDRQLQRTPGGGKRPDTRPIEPSAPEGFGLVQVWWGDGKGKTTAAIGMGVRAAGHGYRVHMLQFMKGGASSVEPVRGEYNAIAAMPGFTYENAGHYGWHALQDGSDDDEHAAKARGALDRACELVDSIANVDLESPFPLDCPPENGIHMLVLDEILYAANRELVDPEAIVELIESKPDGLELVLTGGHEEPTYLLDSVDLVTNVRNEKHPFEGGYRARRGTEY